MHSSLYNDDVKLSNCSVLNCMYISTYNVLTCKFSTSKILKKYLSNRPVERGHPPTPVPLTIHAVYLKLIMISSYLHSSRYM